MSQRTRTHLNDIDRLLGYRALSRPSQATPRTETGATTADQAARIRAAWRNSHLLAPQLARKFGVSLPQVILAIEAANVARE